MKKIKTLITYTLIAICTINNVKAQLPNSNFENWTIDAGNKDSLIGWSSSNSVVFHPVVSLYKEDIAPYQGNSSAHLSTAPFGWVGYSTVGVMVNGNATFFYGGGGGNNSVELQSGGGTPLSYKPNQLKGYYKAPANTVGNLPLVKVLLSRYNTLTNKRDTISYTEFNFSTSATYSPFSIPLVDLLPGVTPDTVMTVFYSSNPATVGPNGVFADFYLDSLELPMLETFGTDTQIACSSYTWIDGITYTSSNNTATDTLINIAGYDSIVTLDLTINFSNTGIDAQLACGPYSWIDGNIYTSDNNTAIFTLTNVGGCDSVVTLNLTIDTVNSDVSQVGTLLTADESGATYQWLECPAMSVINGATAQSYTATVNGDYAVIVTKNGCSDTSSCFSVNTVDISDNKFGNKFLLYPNPTDGKLLIDLGNVTSINSYIIRTIDGRTVKSGKTTKNKINIDLESETSGVYFLTILSDEKTSTHKVIKR